MKQISCDSSSIIALSSNCLMWVLDRFETDFIIPFYVKKEIIDTPLKGKKYSFEAMKHGLLIGNTLKIKETDSILRDKIIKLSNTLLMHKNKPIEIIQYGEADAIALAIKEGITTLLVDEKNTRLLIEDMEGLKKVIERRTGRDFEINKTSAQELHKLLDGLKIIRSTELVAVAIKRGFFDWPYPRANIIKNALTALKFSGCAISSREINETVDILTNQSSSPK